MFWVYLKNLSVPKNLRTLKTNFEKADGLGNSFAILSSFKIVSNISSAEIKTKSADEYNFERTEDGATGI